MEDISFKARMEVKHPSLIQLYSFPTPNGIKIAAVLEEIVEWRKQRVNSESEGELGNTGTVSDEVKMLVYESHAVNIRSEENRLQWFRELGFKTGKIPGIIDPCGIDNCKISFEIIKYFYITCFC